MPPSRRLADLEKNLELWYEQLGAAEKRLAITDEIFAKNAIESARLRFKSQANSESPLKWTEELLIISWCCSRF